LKSRNIKSRTDGNDAGADTRCYLEICYAQTQSIQNPGKWEPTQPWPMELGAEAEDQKLIIIQRR